MKKKTSKLMFKKMIFLNFSEGNLLPKFWKRIDRISKQRYLIPENEIKQKKYIDADCLLLKLGMTADKELINSMPNLKYIGMFGTGFGRVDTQTAAKAGITVCNIADYATEGVAEFVVGCILEKLRDLTRAKLQAHYGNYSESNFTGTEIRNKKFGIVGLGHIGSRVADIVSRLFGAEVAYYNRTKKETGEKIQYKKLETLLAESEILSFHLALNEGTSMIINKELMNKI